jgi:hypothetical protein
MHSVTYFFALSESEEEALSPSFSGVNMQAIFLDEGTFDTVNLVVPVFKSALVVLTRNGSFATIETSAMEGSSSSSSVRLRK